MGPITLIAGAIKLAQEIYALVELAEKNQKDLSVLADTVRRIMVAVERLQALPRERQEMFVLSLERLSACLGEIKLFIPELSRSSFVFRLFKASDNKAKILSYQNRIEGMFPELTFELAAHAVVHGEVTMEMQLASLSGEALYQMGMSAEEKGQDIQAFDFYKRAYRQGYVKAVTQIGKCHLLGIGVEINYAEAERHLRVGVSNNHAFAMYFLGVMFERGSAAAGVDLQEALSWYEKSIAIDPGNVKCQERLDKLLTRMNVGLAPTLGMVQIR